MANTTMKGAIPLITGNFPVADMPIVVKAGTAFAAYTVMMLDASGKAIAWDGTAGKAVCILASPVTEETKVADSNNVGYISGTFNPDLLIFPASVTTLAAKRAAFATDNILLQGVVA